MVLKGKTAVITGATSGIGLALALNLIQVGVRGILIGRNFTELKKAISNLKIDSSKIKMLHADFTDVDQLESLGKKLTSETKIDILIHAAGVISLGSLENESIENLDNQYKVNVATPFYITQKLLPHLKNTKGNIIFLNSIASLLSYENKDTILYATSKHAKKALATAMGKALAKEGIKVTNIFLGSTATPMQERIQKNRGNIYEPKKYMPSKEVAEIMISILKIPSNMTISDITLTPF